MRLCMLILLEVVQVFVPNLIKETQEVTEVR